EAGPGLRWAEAPRVELDPFGAARGGALTLRFGDGVRIGRGLTVDVRVGGENVLELGDRVIVQSWCRLQLHGGAIRIGDDVHVRDLVQVKTKSAVEVGARTVLSRDVVVHATAGVTIGADCGVGERTSLIDSDHTLDGRGGAYLQAPLRAEPISLGSGVAIGANCVLLRGTRMGDGAALAAGAVANGLEVEPGWLAGGLPARPLRALSLESS
ncbi:MAG: Chloramphenicol acetyltransferase, partial [Solirubrobacterales bacterium]|nr:Chloramphenicol acetyltransferase [Solirubrobacterales bacterium]